MILTVDIGNSRIKWAFWQDDEIVARAAAAYTSDRYSDAFDRLLLDINKAFEVQPKKVFAICVAGDAVQKAFSAWVKNHWCLGVEYITTKKRYENIVNAYEDPNQHGVDRWVGIIAACQNYPGLPICVVGAGTAITFDLIKEDGRHLGGYILPSFMVMHDALLKGTAGIMSVSNVGYKKQSVPDNTNDAVNMGLHMLLQAGIRELCELARDELGKSMQIVLTGGFSQVILGYPDMPMMRYEPDLIMKGLYHIAKQQKLEVGT